MTGFAGAEFLRALPLSAAAIAVLLALTLAVALRVGRHSVVDVAWGLGFVVVALLGFGLSAGHGDPLRRGVVTAATVIWGLRLAVHIARRGHGSGEDPRYAELLDKAPGNRTAYAIRMIYLLQGVMIWFIALPVLLTEFCAARPGPVAGAGVVVWLAGLVFEAVGDAQLAAFKAERTHHGTIMDRGLWRYTRHPNYFGDACVWWGLFLIAADAWPGVLTVLSPLLMTFFLVRGTGARMTERRMAGRPGFAEYVRRTSGFVPWPPRAR